MAYYYVCTNGTVNGSATGDAGRSATERNTTFALMGASACYASINAALSATTPPTDGDYILCASNHSFDYSANQIILYGGNITIVSVDVSDSSSYLAGATELAVGASAYDYNTANNAANKYTHHIGMTYKASDELRFANNGDTHAIFRNCNFELTKNALNDLFGSTAASDGVASKFFDCTFTFGNSNQHLTSHCGHFMQLNDCTFAHTSTAGGADYFIVGGGNGGQHFRFNDCNLSSFPSGTVLGDWSGTANDSVTVQFNRCKMPSSFSISDTGFAAPHTEVDLYSCDSGNGYHYYHHARYGGEIFENTATYRSGGADNGASTNNLYSSQVITTGKSTFSNPLKVPLRHGIHIDLSGGNKTLTWHLIIGKSTDTITAPTNKDVWIEVEYPDNTALAYGKVATSLDKNLLQTGTTLTTSGATWGGTSAGTYTDKREIAVTVPQCTNGANSTVTAWLCVSKDFTVTNSETLFVCPKPVIT